MKTTNNPQTNTRTYWNYIYTTPARSKEYWEKTCRFFNAANLVSDGDKFLDVGCGVGIPGRLVLERKKGCEVWGVDISNEIIEANKKDIPQGKWYQGYADHLGFLPENYFDITFAGEIIEHMDEPQKLFNGAYKVLKNGGKLIVTTPIENHIDSPEHVWYFGKQDIENFYTEAGFKDIIFVDLPDMEYLCVFFVVGTK